MHGLTYFLVQRVIFVGIGKHLHAKEMLKVMDSLQHRNPICQTYPTKVRHV
jgi:hypothetical protein